MKNITVLEMGGAFYREALLGEPVLGDALDFVDLYDLPNLDLESHVALIVSSMADQKFLFEHRAVIRDFLDAGKVLVSNGSLFKRWFPGAGEFVPKDVHSFRDYSVHKAKHHPIFEGVAEDDLTFRKGVAGIFARGHNEPPEGAEVIITLNGGEPVLYIDRESSGGTILAHSGGDLLGHIATESSARRIVPQLVHWIHAETRSLARERSLS